MKKIKQPKYGEGNPLKFGIFYIKIDWKPSEKQNRSGSMVNKDRTVKFCARNL